MNLSFDQKFELLDNLSNEISSGSIPKANSEWNDAGIKVHRIYKQKGDILESDGFDYLPASKADALDINQVVIYTNYSFELSWAFGIMDKMFKDVYDSILKNDLFVRFANVIEVVQDINPNANAKELVKCVIHEAKAVIEEVKDGYFMALPISALYQQNKAIIEAEKSGYAGIEATVKFFQEMEERGHGDV
jgi:hypothetical protein